MTKVRRVSVAKNRDMLLDTVNVTDTPERVTIYGVYSYMPHRIICIQSTEYMVEVTASD